jgi:glycosyltransferase involved in cell wall biosynthesis
VPDLETDSSLTVIRALQASCPVVATNIIGFKEWLSPALLAPPNDVTALHETLCATIRALANLKANYLPIFLRAQQELTMDYMVQQTERFYFDLLECT